jgi:hypothetical protein
LTTPKKPTTTAICSLLANLDFDESHQNPNNETQTALREITVTISAQSQPEKTGLFPVIYGKRPTLVPYVELVKDELFASIHVDHDGATRILLDADLNAWSADLASLMPQAVSNLRKVTAPFLTCTLGPVGKVWSYRSDDGHAASRILLLPELCGVMPAEGLLAAIPSADELFFVELDEIGNIEDLLVLLVACQRSFQTAASPISDQLFWFNGKKWTKLPVDYANDSLSLEPTEAFVQAIRRLTALSLFSTRGEA